MRSRRSALPALLILISSWPAPVNPATPEQNEERSMCRYDKLLCEEFSSLKEKTAAAASQEDLETCFAAYREFLVHRDDAVARLKLPDDIAFTVFREPGDVVKAALNAKSMDAAPMDLTRVASAISDLEARLDAMQADPKAITVERIVDLNTQGTAIWERLRRISDNVSSTGAPMRRTDAIGHYEMLDVGKVITERINPLEKRIADLAERLKGLAARTTSDSSARVPSAAFSENASNERLNKKGLLSNPFAANDTPDEHDASQSRGAPRRQNLPGIDLTFQKPTLLDMHLVATPPPQEVKPVSWLERLGLRSFFSKPAPSMVDADENWDPSLTKYTEELRSKGRTQIFGDPVRRAKLIFHQTGGTCAIASQVEILADRGMVDADRKALKEMENALFERAAAKGYFNGPAGDDYRKIGGTPLQFAGDLLNVPVQKRFLAKDDELINLLKTGKMIMVGVDYRTLWHRVASPGGHEITLTGLEVDRETGRPLGVFINDTGEGVGGRFVSAPQFFDAWHDGGSSYVEPL